jgi:hypothetical protein
MLFEPNIKIEHTSHMVNIYNLINEIKTAIQKHLIEDIDVSMGVATGECEKCG